MVTSNSEQDGSSTQATDITNNAADGKKEEPNTAREGGDMEEESERKDENASPHPTDSSSSDKMDTSPSAPTASGGTTSSGNVTAGEGIGLSPGLGGLGRHRGLTEQLSRTPSSLSRVSNNMAAMLASKVTPAATGSTVLSSSLTPSEQLKQQQLLQVSKKSDSLSLSLSHTHTQAYSKFHNISPSLPLSLQIVEASDLLVGSDVLLLESQIVSEDKEVGPEIPGNDDQLSKLDTMLEENKELDKELTSSELEG